MDFVLLVLFSYGKVPVGRIFCCEDRAMMCSIIHEMTGQLQYLEILPWSILRFVVTLQPKI